MKWITFRFNDDRNLWDANSFIVFYGFVDGVWPENSQNWVYF